MGEEGVEPVGGLLGGGSLFGVGFVEELVGVVAGLFAQGDDGGGGDVLRIVGVGIGD